MGFVEDTLAARRSDAVAALDLPRRQHYHPSPASWQDELVYFLLVDRFSDGVENARRLSTRKRCASSIRMGRRLVELTCWSTAPQPTLILR